MAIDLDDSESSPVIGLVSSRCGKQRMTPRFRGKDWPSTQGAFTAFGGPSEDTLRRVIQAVFVRGCSVEMAGSSRLVDANFGEVYQRL